MYKHTTSSSSPQQLKVEIYFSTNTANDKFPNVVLSHRRGFLTAESIFQEESL